MPETNKKAKTLGDQGRELCVGPRKGVFEADSGTECGKPKYDPVHNLQAAGSHSFVPPRESSESKVSYKPKETQVRPNLDDERQAKLHLVGKIRIHLIGGGMLEGVVTDVIWAVSGHPMVVTVEKPMEKLRVPWSAFATYENLP